MKRILFVLLCAAVSLFAASCNEAHDLTGSVDLTIGQSTFHMPVASFVSSDGRTKVSGTNVSQTIEIDFKGTDVRQYTLGYGKDFDELKNNHPFGEDFSSEANLSFVSTVGERTELRAVCGVLTVQDYGSDSIVAVFSGKGLEPGTADALIGGGYTPEAVEPMLKTFSGQFVAVPQKAK